MCGKRDATLRLWSYYDHHSFYSPVLPTFILATLACYDADRHLSLTRTDTPTSMYP
ncbi:hypothetical protein BDR06DRAFT_960764 [Suillus hirtellus]|nr:hypothetical protein BDR06DRAFT_960764 [Suillus hirtellus]